MAYKITLRFIDGSSCVGEMDKVEEPALPQNFYRLKTGKDTAVYFNINHLMSLEIEEKK